MSRAINVTVSQAEVVALAAKHNVVISAIEALHPAGTRVVFMNSDDTAVMARAFGAKILTARVTRTRAGQARYE